MKITANRKALAAALKTATVPAASGHLAILGGLHLEAFKGGKLTCTGTNLDLTVTLDIDADVTVPGVVILPGRLFAGLVDKAASDTITLIVEHEHATIEAGKTVATLRTLRVEDWPKVHTADGERFELHALDVERLSHVLHAVQTDAKKLSGRPALGGVHFAGNTAEATDSYRLAIAQLGCEDLPGRIVPLDVINRVVKASPGGVTLTFDNRSVTFDSADSNTTWTSTLIPAEFPKTEQLIRKESKHALTVNRHVLADALSRVRLLADGDETHPVDLTPEGMLLRLSATSVDVGDIYDEVACTGDWGQPIRFHDRYLADLLANHDGDEITFELDDPLKPVQCRTSDWRLTLLIMPVRIDV